MALKKLTVGLLALGLAGNAAAEDTLQQIIDGLGNTQVNVATDALNDDLDSVWTMNANGVGSSTLIIELTSGAASQVFGVYAGTDYVPLFTGGAVAGDKSIMTIFADGSLFVGTLLGGVSDTGVDLAGNQFGFYLETGGGAKFHSETADNANGNDHMLALQGVGENITLPGGVAGPWATNEYILGFEDGTDYDYQDLVVMIESISPIPEPGLAALLGAGLVGLGISRRKNRAA